MSLFLSEIALNPRSRDVHADLEDVYSLHLRIMSCFAKQTERQGEARRHFGVLFRVEMRKDRLSLLVQSAQEPDLTRLPLNYDVARRGPNPFLPVFRTGQLLRFRLRANPARRLSRGSKDKLGNPVAPEHVGKRVPIRDSEQRTRWLMNQGCRPAHAFSLAELHTTWGPAHGPRPPGVQMLEANAETVRGTKHGRAITIEGALFEGRLRVEDPQAFARCIANGIGPGKAFGFGLLSLAPP
jgi:CRISPR system Cascade subunit CasE